MVIPEILETWNVIDRWWTQDPVTREYREVCWNNRKIVMVKEDNDSVWRIWQPKK